VRFFRDFLKNIEKPAAPKRDAQQTAHCHKKKGNDYNGYADCTKLKGAENYICPGSSAATGSFGAMKEIFGCILRSRPMSM